MLIHGRFETPRTPKRRNWDRSRRYRHLLAALSVETEGAAIRLSGLNLQIVPGAGATDRPINAKGNRIVAYDELRPMRGFCSFTPLPTGVVSAEGASVSGGFQNMASGPTASVSGGLLNLVTTSQASVWGGAGSVAGRGHPFHSRGAAVRPSRLGLRRGEQRRQRRGRLRSRRHEQSRDRCAIDGRWCDCGKVTGTNEWHAAITSGFPSATDC